MKVIRERATGEMVAWWDGNNGENIGIKVGDSQELIVIDAIENSQDFNDSLGKSDVPDGSFFIRELGDSVADISEPSYKVGGYVVTGVSNG